MTVHPEPVIQAAAEVRLRQYGSEYTADHLTWRDFADEVTEILDGMAEAGYTVAPTVKYEELPAADPDPRWAPTQDDADGLRDLADRSRRAAKTAARTAGATADADLSAMLADLVLHLEAAAALAAVIANRIDGGTR